MTPSVLRWIWKVYSSLIVTRRLEVEEGCGKRRGPPFNASIFIVKGDLRERPWRWTSNWRDSKLSFIFELEGFLHRATYRSGHGATVLPNQRGALWVRNKRPILAYEFQDIHPLKCPKSRLRESTTYFPPKRRCSVAVSVFKSYC